MKANLFSRAFAYLAAGISIGAVVCTLSLLAAYGMTGVLREMAVWLIASAVIGLVSLVYECERLTDLTATLIHAPVTLGIALLSGWVLGYGDGSVPLLLARMLPTVVILYALIHLFLFLMRCLLVRALNSRLQK